MYILIINYTNPILESEQCDVMDNSVFIKWFFHSHEALEFMRSWTGKDLTNSKASKNKLQPNLTDPLK
jgi:hypothetical protein